MSRTAIFVSNDYGADIKISGCTGHIVLESDTVDVPTGTQAKLIGSIGDPSTGKDNTGTITIIGVKRNGEAGASTAELRKRTGKQMTLLGYDGNDFIGIDPTNDYEDDKHSIYATSINLHVKVSPKNT